MAEAFTHTLVDFARDLGRVQILYQIARRIALEEACEIVEKEAKRVIGTYDYGWPQLAESTQKDRVSKGFAANEPLLRTGELRDSIEHEIDGDAGYVGSKSRIALYQELGTGKIPPHSFLMGAAMAKEKEIHELGAKFAHSLVLKALGLPSA